MKANHKIQVIAKAWMPEPFFLVGRGEVSLSSRELAFRTQKSIDSYKRKEEDLMN